MPSLQRKKIKGHWYWYLVECRRVNGKPRPFVLKYLGRNEKLLQLLTNPGANAAQTGITTYAYGAVRSLLKVAEDLGLSEVFGRHFPDQERNGLNVAQTLLLASIYRALTPGSKRAFSTWARRTALPYLVGFDPAAMTSQHFWDQMNAVTDEQLKLVETEVSRKVVEQVGLPLEVLLYDVTNFYTYVSTGNTRNRVCQRGHNKQRRNDLRQFNFALLVARQQPLPIWWAVYEGNLPDVAAFPTFIARIRTALQAFAGEIKDITVVVDKGNYSKRIQQQLEQAGLDWIGSLPLATLPEVCRIEKRQFYPVTVAGREVLAYRLERSLWGKDLTLVMTFSAGLRDGQLRGYEQRLAKTTAFLKVANGSKRGMVKLRHELTALLAREHVGEVVKVKLGTAAGRIKLDWRIDLKRYRYLCDEYFGRRLLLTTRADFTDEEIIRGYDGLGTIENVFRRMKDPFHLSVIPEYHWTDQKIRVHVFTCVMGLILTGLLQKRVRDHGIEISAGRLLDELSSVREVWATESVSGGTKPSVKRQLEDMSQETRRIVEATGI